MEVTRVTILKCPWRKSSTSKKKPLEATPKPLQVRWPREGGMAIKVAAVRAEQTTSRFMLGCFHAYMRTQKPGEQESGDNQ
jgi:hypothetical protein